MNCNEAVARIAALADGELDPVQSDLLERHLMRCANCAAFKSDTAIHCMPEPCVTAMLKPRTTSGRCGSVVRACGRTKTSMWCSR